jgi:hypothetical protein
MSELSPATFNIKRSMTQRNITNELSYYIYNDPEYGEDIEHICYPSLIRIITELCDRIEKLEEKLTEIRSEKTK